ncbi:DUF305 domain-containing protein [Lolliginicoccus suaedae]|uniref:DUF305 domain-containing protein n=1 Tax=Lolliginicoccus suaedae TaxID=2605429 RepID=UPI0011F00D1B|nr:DUF305 domain-containing protein [Lolliginicoccus suaedae]
MRSTGNYLRFGLVLLASLVLMFLLSMSMVRTVDHFHLNLSNFYISLVMVSAMALVMMVGMRSMFQKKGLNIALSVFFVALFLGAWSLGRTETFVGNEGFLKSMIPHHSRAILVCQESSLTDPEIIELCRQIVETQREEIAQMERILEDRY